MSAEHILRVPRSDSDGDFVLVNVTNNGKSPLDLKLLATEGESPYVAELRHSRITKLRDKRSRLSDEQWESLLLSSLLEHRNSDQTSFVEKLEIIANVTGDVLAVQFRNNISGITQKLGEMSLKKDESQELDITTWCATAVQRSTDFKTEVQELTVKYEEQSATVEKLNKQLEDLIEAKKKHEDALLEKFRELLNTKKLKIRDQQRLLAGAKVDPKHAARVEQAREISKPHTVTASRAGKRKAKGAATASESSDNNSFEPKVPVQNNESDASERINTPEASDPDVTEDESDDDLDSAPRQNAMPERKRGGEDDDSKDKGMQIDTPPPVRALPFGNATSGGGKGLAKETPAEDSSTLNQEAGNEDEETEDDDEL